MADAILSLKVNIGMRYTLAQAGIADEDVPILASLCRHPNLDNNPTKMTHTLALEPDLLLLDEPFSALDYQTRLAVCDDISSIIKSTHKTAILITHDLSEAISVADRVIILTSRPGRMKGIVPVSFGEGYVRPLERRNTPEFSTYFNQVWKELQTHD